ncbi:MAG: transposase [Zavarzinia sp.]|nr:transposase [Zavarzinia sp.]
MARLPRVVIPGVPHHVTQRGNRRQPVFFSEADYILYRDLVAASCRAAGVSCLAWCLMPTEVHLILTPPDADGLRAALAEAHRRYSRKVNEGQGWTGYLWQGRFASYPMDDAHLMAAIRYVENSPVAAGLAAKAEDWPWSSARAHVTGKADGFTDLATRAGPHRKGRALPRRRLEAGDLPEDEVEAIEGSLRTGRPRGDDAFLERLEAVTGRVLKRQKPGPKGRRD